MMTHIFRKAAFSSAAILITSTTQAATINLSYTGTNSSGSSIEALFTIDSDDLTAAPSPGPGPIEPGPGFGSASVALSSAQYISNGSTITFDTTDGYYGLDINGETTEFRTGTGGNQLQLTSIYDSAFSYDATSGSVTYSGQYNDPSLGFTGFSYSGTDFLINLSPISTSSASFQGFANTASLNESFSVDSLHISVSDVTAVPIPAAVWLFASGLIGLASFAKRRS